MPAKLLSKCARDLGIDAAELQRRILTAVAAPTPQSLPYLLYVMDEAKADHPPHPVTVEGITAPPEFADQVLRTASELRQVNPTECPWFDRYLKSQASRIAADVAHCAKLAPPGARCLDIGSAPYLFLLSMRRLDRDFSAVDIHPERYAETVRHFDLDVRSCNIEIDRLPFDDHTFDLVVMHEVFEHMRIDLLHVFEEVRRVLKPGGLLTLSSPNLRSLRGMTRILRDGIALSCAGDIFNEYGKLRSIGHMGHVREYTAPEITQFLEDMGFSVTGLVYRGAPDKKRRRPFRPEWSPFLRLTARPAASPEETAAVLRAALDQRPDNVVALSRLAASVDGASRDALLADAQQTIPNLSRRLMDVGLRLKDRGRRREAVAALEQARAIDPGNADAAYHHCECLQTLGRLGQAAEAARASVTMAPNGPGRRMQLGKLLVKIGRPREARQHLTAALDLSPDLDLARRLLAELDES